MRVRICTWRNEVSLSTRVQKTCIQTYSGTTRLAPPTARPTMLLPNIIPGTLLVKACHNAPTVNSISATRTTYFRPRRSASTLAKGLAIRAKRLVEEVIKLLSRVDSGWERSGPIETRVEEITPVLEPSVSVVHQVSSLRLTHNRTVYH